MKHVKVFAALLLAVTPIEALARQDTFDADIALCKAVYKVVERDGGDAGELFALWARKKGWSWERRQTAMLTCAAYLKGRVDEREYGSF